MTPLEVVETALTAHGCHPQRRGDHVDARCPSHEDANPSLSVDAGVDGRALVHCHAGCPAAEIVAALNLEITDLFPDLEGPAAMKREVVATYPYTDGGGALLYEVVRFAPKDFRQRRPDGAGGWVWNLRGVDRVPYRLPELFAGIASKRWVLVVEGEKDVERLRAFGFVATCNAMGAGKWQPSWASLFKGAKVAVVPDADAAGREHAEHVASSLADVAAEVKLLELPGLAEHGDVSDWIAAGGTAAELKRLILEAPTWAPGGQPVAEAEPETDEPTPADGDDYKWSEPVPLPASRDCVGFCRDILGDRVAGFCEAVATETGTPVDLPAIAALGTVSAVVAGAVVVEGSQGWREPTNLYLNLLAAPGEGKTPAMRKVVRPLDLVEKERRERTEDERREASSRLRVAETRRKRLEEAAAKAGPGERDEALDAALAAGREVAEIVVPPQPRVYTREATPEALVRLLADQEGRLAVVTDEGSDFYEMASRYSGNGKGNVGVYVDGFDGKRHLSDRAGRDPIVIERTTLTVCLFGQPVVLRELGGDVQMAGRGVLARFCWSLPTTKVGRRPVQRESVDDGLLEEWAELVCSLARQAEGIGEPVVLRLSAEAKRTWDAWREQHEPRLRPDVGDLASIVEWAAKLPGQVLRYAGVLHAMRTGRLDGVIAQETMEAALVLAGYFTDHALVVFAKMAADKRLDDARSVLRWVLGREHAEFTTRDLCRSRDWEADRSRAALEALAEYAWVRQLPRETTNGRPSERWERNPETPRQNPTEAPTEGVLSGSVGHFGRAALDQASTPEGQDASPDAVLPEAELAALTALLDAASREALDELQAAGFFDVEHITFCQRDEIVAILERNEQEAQS